MKFSTREDIATPIEVVFARVSAFEIFERQALRRGAQVRRLDPGPVAEGSIWDATFKFRGKDRKLRANLTRFQAPTLIKVDSVSSGINGETVIELMPLSPSRTRMAVSIELRAKTLSARLLLQSLKLAKGTLTNRFKRRVGSYAEMIEEDHSGPKL